MRWLLQPPVFASPTCSAVLVRVLDLGRPTAFICARWNLPPHSHRPLSETVCRSLHPPPASHGLPLARIDSAGCARFLPVEAVRKLLRPVQLQRVQAMRRRAARLAATVPADEPSARSVQQQPQQQPTGPAAGENPGFRVMRGWPVDGRWMEPSYPVTWVFNAHMVPKHLL